MKQYLPWFASLALLIVVLGTIYTTVQQSQRSDANYPQIQIAQDAAKSIDQGDVPLRFQTQSSDIGSSLAPFTIVYDKSGRVVSGTGYLERKIPKAPLGMLTDSKNKAYNEVTWEPKKNVRIAAITVAAKDYYVLSGRSLREVEKNEARTLQLVLLGGVLSMMLLGLVFVLSGISTEDY